jgi:membrane protein YqaA with SNARE-associated domain
MWDVLLSLFVGAIVSGVVPIFSAEVITLVAAAAVPAAGAPLVALVTTTGQMISKTALYGLARWAPAYLPRRAQVALEHAGDRLASHQRVLESAVFVSGVVGFPPFYGVSLAAGALRMRILSFILVGGAGRFVRFGAVAGLGWYFGPTAIEAVRETGWVSSILGLGR